jgi:hypothetical protein
MAHFAQEQVHSVVVYEVSPETAKYHKWSYQDIHQVNKYRSKEYTTHGFGTERLKDGVLHFLGHIPCFGGNVVVLISKKSHQNTYHHNITDVGEGNQNDILCD